MIPRVRLAPICPTDRPARAAAVLGLLAVTLLGGCGPTRTAGTHGVAKRDLAVLSVPQLPKIAHLRIQTIQFDGDDETYNVGGGRDFYLLPKARNASFMLKAVLPPGTGVVGKLLPKDALNFPGPATAPRHPVPRPRLRTGRSDRRLFEAVGNRPTVIREGKAGGVSRPPLLQPKS